MNYNSMHHLQLPSKKLFTKRVAMGFPFTHKDIENALKEVNPVIINWDQQVNFWFISAEDCKRVMEYLIQTL